MNKNRPRKRFRAKDENGNKLWHLTANSIVTQPAIERDFKLFSAVEMPGFNLIFSESKKLNKEVFSFDNDKMEITGPFMIPNIDILRQDPETGELYDCYFTEQDVEDFAEMLVQDANHNQANFEHGNIFTDKVKLKEIWIVTNPNMDKSKELGFKNIIKGTAFNTVKVYDRELWEKIKNSPYRGFSVEIESNEYQEIQKDSNDIFENLYLSKEEKLSALIDIYEFNSFIHTGEVSFKDYPIAAIENAKRALAFKEANPDLKCGNNLLWSRCKQIANNLPLTYSNLKRISLNIKNEAKANAAAYDYGCAKCVWDAFGGTELIYWSVQRLQQIDALVKQEVEKSITEKSRVWPYR
jgi:hypothetical protein